MLNVLELERQWRRYKIRKIAPYFVLTILLFFAALTFLLWSNHSLKPIRQTKAVVTEPVVTTNILYTEKTEPESNDVDNMTALKEEKQLEKLSSTLTLPAKTTEPVKTVAPLKSSTITSKEPTSVAVTGIPTLSPSLGFMKRMKTNLLLHKNDTVIVNQSTSTNNTLKKPQPSLSFTPLKEASHVQIPQQEPVVQEKTPSKAKIQLKPIETIQAQTKEEDASITSNSKEVSNLSIVRKYDNKDLRDVMHRFEKNRSPALSLFITKRFYALEDYQQAYNYALITNEIDSDIEDSWIIFSKSLVKLDQKDLAVSTLKSYISESHSVKASILLDNIQKGKFK